MGAVEARGVMGTTPRVSPSRLGGGSLRRDRSLDALGRVCEDQSSMKTKPFLIVLLILNVVVLLGQLWPEGAPPFARAVNIAFLCGSLIYLGVAAWRA